MALRLRICAFLLLLARLLPAQAPNQISNYINTYRLLAIAEMQRSGVPASIILAQGIHETQAGTSDLVIASNNHFGIKCKTAWAGNVVYHDDDARGECFRSYATAEDSYRDHSDYLSQTPRYAFLFKLNPEDYQSWAYGLKKAGYATNMKYAQILIRIIQDFDLQKYSLIALGKRPAEQPAEGTLTSHVRPKSLDGFTDSPVQKTANILYPDGPFVINAAKVIYVKAGVSLLALSNLYEIPLARLLEFNDMKQEDVLNSDQLVFLQRKRKNGLTPYHIVQLGESMYMICQAEGVRYENLLEYNHKKPGDEPAPGEKIYLQTIPESKPVPINPSSVKTVIPSS